MRNKYILVLAFLALGMVGCSKSSDANNEATVTNANPVTQEQTAPVTSEPNSANATTQNSNVPPNTVTSGVAQPSTAVAPETANVQTQQPPTATNEQSSLPSAGSQGLQTAPSATAATPEKNLAPVVPQTANSATPEAATSIQATQQPAVGEPTKLEPNTAANPVQPVVGIPTVETNPVGQPAKSLDNEATKPGVVQTQGNAKTNISFRRLTAADNNDDSDNKENKDSNSSDDATANRTLNGTNDTMLPSNGSVEDAE
jgi:hypothetical protein